ncbi:cell wall metabolism sensor histidine kinase WalK [Pseudogracilibacillus auburnensis]|uniref:histidine kinase n=1 Tax=Pseudogracilibacillus auburnensis TaxID=1494959 RepID=A0A2V3VP32_9BACI|nr:cell wall metabolism sensor histidine kinase WalK [Pseudogracilibacillus auburnensis]MBO1004144.1 cell wall metabolism sensor histidine kinase WalK [Pseudogracilibacillus auburnensis]PXW83617.1 PAS/PAC sensor signal transduction histidine kinase [Pseudogracilibacillus auburnensis]
MKKVGFFRSIQLKFIVIYILLLIIAVQVIGSYVARELEAELLDNFKESTNDRIDLLSYNLEQAFNKKRTDDPLEPTLQEDIQNIVIDVDRSGATTTTIQVINNQGRVLGTNDYLNQDIIGKKITEDIVQRAIKFKTSLDNTLLNSKTGERMFVRVEPIEDIEGNVQGVIYLETSLEGVYGQLQKINEIFFKGSIIALVVSVILGILVARAITKPIVEMRRQAQTMARGDFSQKVKVYGTDEISQLAVTFNHLNDRLKHSMATIEKEQRKLSSVLENMTEGVIATDNKGEITLINEAAGRLFNENPNSLISKDLLLLLDLEEKVEDIIELQESGSVVLDFSDEEDLFIVRANFSAIYDDHRHSRTSGIITVLSDVTEDEKVEQERREFVSNVSHELRTPLTTLRSYLEALTDGAWKDPVIAPKFLEVIQNETERMIRMVNSLLQLSRMDSKEHTLHREDIDFTPFFHNIIDRFEMNVKDEKINFNRQIPNKSFHVWIDKDRLTQVLDNIISNAVKYSPDGGTITLKIERHIRQIVVSVRDEGIGIEYDKLDKIFDRFYRVDKARTRQLGGTGLGLAITRELVEAHYGRIWANSKEGKGTTIYFTLPLINHKRRREI